MNPLQSVRIAIDVLWPIITQAADYLSGKRDDLPDVPATLKSRLELEKAKARTKS